MKIIGSEVAGAKLVLDASRTAGFLTHAANKHIRGSDMNSLTKCVD